MCIHNFRVCVTYQEHELNESSNNCTQLFICIIVSFEICFSIKVVILRFYSMIASFIYSIGNLLVFIGVNLFVSFHFCFIYFSRQNTCPVSASVDIR